jgi:hypothetical protein
VPCDFIDVHPYQPGAFIVHQTIDANEGLYRTFFGQATPGSTSVDLFPLTPYNTSVTPPVQILAWWAGWSTGGFLANTTVYIMCQEEPSLAPNNGMALRQAHVSFGATASAITEAVPLIGDLSDFTQIGNFSIVECVLPQSVDAPNRCFVLLLLPIHSSYPLNRPPAADAVQCIAGALSPTTPLHRLAPAHRHS